jgi:hypothetical protein
MDGEVLLFGTYKILRHATNYYKALFDPRSGDTFEQDPELWPSEKNVTIEENYDLTKMVQGSR